MKRCVLLAAALLVMGHKCGDKPRAPKAQAAEAVEEAYFLGDVEAELGRAPLAVELDDPELGIVVVVFTREDGRTKAWMTLDGEELVFSVLEDGQVTDGRSPSPR